MTWVLPVAVALGAVLAKVGASSLVLVVAVAAAYACGVVYETRKEALAARVSTQKAEAAARATREAALAAETLALSPRERCLLEELDARTWLDTTVGVVWGRYHARVSAWLEATVAGVLDGLTPLGPVETLTFTKFAPGSTDYIDLKTKRVVKTTKYRRVRWW